MTDGHTYDVPHPEVMVVSRSYATIGLRADPESGVFERVEHLGLIHVVRIEELPPDSAAGAAPGSN
jgi:hypothetical protein